jgi:uncharacterized protein
MMTVTGLLRVMRVPAGAAVSVVCLMALSLVMFTASSAVRAAPDDAAQGTFLTPFPDSDVYRMTVIGDDFADGLKTGLSGLLGDDARVSIHPATAPFAGIMTASFDKKVQDLEAALKGREINVAAVMMGYWDRISLRSSSGRRVRVASEEWLAEYSRRVDQLMKVMKRAAPSVYWVGLPVHAKYDANEAAQRMNDAIRERAYLNGIKYIDAYAGFVDEESNYAAYGPDLDGKVRQLRLRDGVGFTEQGKRKLAHFVEQEFKRDLIQARASRSVALLGTAEEQARINPDNANKAKGLAAGAAGAGAGKDGSANAASVNGGAAVSGSGDQKEDHGRVVLQVTGPGGRIESQTVEIVRPAIPASVVSLMARRQSAGQMGDMLVQQIEGGLTLMSTMTSSNNKSKGRLAPTQAPYFRLLVKGERLAPKPGRADDTSWLEPEKSSSRIPQMQPRS